jgi:phosphoribosylglycinamide formyltransferase-1
MKNLCAFTYAFDHAKCQNGLLKLVTEGLKPKLVIAQPSKFISPNPDSIGLSPKKAQALVDWEKLLRLLNINYIFADHDSQIAISEIKKHECDLGVILGARILKKDTISQFKHGILNMHPGLLPFNRGLDNLKKAILYDYEPMVTFHLIDEEIDSGKIIDFWRVPVYETDSLHSIFLRHQAIELDGMIWAIRGLQNGSLTPFSANMCEYKQKLGDKYDKDVLAKFPEWLKKYSQKK